MSKPTLIPSIYGYLVCLACVIVFLIAAPQLVESIVDLFNPIRSERAPEIASQSYESWRAEYLERWGNQYEDTDGPRRVQRTEPPDDATLRTMYMSEKTNAEQNFSHRILASFIERLVLIVIASVLFVVHWRWLRRLSNIPAAA